jgi:transcriptional regulator with XRE-family HTH domain
MCMEMKTPSRRKIAIPPHAEFGKLLAQLRQAAGIAKQAELAKRVRSTQQTVSRWETGTSRPRDKQIPLIATVLTANPVELLEAAGYMAKKTVATFDQPFPLEALSPDSFERFCLHFLSKLYPNADVHRAGESGHTQDGLDVDAKFPGGRSYAFQCKRVDEFGPAKVHAAVSAHKRKATKKIILLTRVASPQAREAIRKYKTWDIWDREDISFRIRELPKHEQIKLADIFFKGQRLALLGEPEPGPWQTAEEFFAAFMSARGAFSHAWNLVGRSDEKKKLSDSLSDPEKQVIFLTGAGGSGKSRVLKEVIEAYAPSHKGTIAFLSPSEKVTNKSLEDLGDCDKVLVVDDAHDRNDLQLLFQFVAVPANKAKILLSFRPYGRDYISAQASTFALAGDRIAAITLEPMTLDETKELARQVLRKFDGPLATADGIARLTRDCPLATVIGAQVVAKDKRHVALVGNEDTFRTTLLGKFQDIIAGEIGFKGDAEPIRKVLRVLALLQPFHPEDKSLAAVVEKVEGLALHEFNRVVRLLTDAGVLFRRGGEYRLSPDLLGDHIIEISCIAQSGASTGYAEKVFDAAGDAHIQYLLLNLGKLDWRRANGDPSNSRLLDGVWAKLKASSDYGDPHIKAVSEVAFYQPGKALDFAERLIYEGTYLRDVPIILKLVAYNYTHVRRACECLWELGKSDKRVLGQHPNHAICILSELCAVEMNKPLGYNRVVVEFGLSLLNQDDAWRHGYTPFDFLSGILAVEGRQTTSNGRTISFGTFGVSPKAVASLRRDIVDAALRLLTNPNVKIAALAAHFLQQTIQYPMDANKVTTAAWTEEFVRTLEKVKEVVRAGKLDPLVCVEILGSTSWHARGDRGTSGVAREIVASMPNTLEFRTLLALTNSYGQLLRNRDFALLRKEVEGIVEALTQELLSVYAEPETLRAYVEERLRHVALHAASKSGYFSGILCGKLMSASLPLARATVEDAIANPESKTRQFAAIALSALFRADPFEGRKIVARFLAEGSSDLLGAVGRAYGFVGLKPEEHHEADLAALRRVFSAADDIVVLNSLGVIRNFATTDPRLAIDMLLCIDIGSSSQVADETLMLLYSDESLPFCALTEADVGLLLNGLTPLPKLHGHWIDAFLSKASKHFPRLCAAFFMRRVEHAASKDDWSYRPSNFGPYGQVPLRFRETPEFGSLLREVSQWMGAHDHADFHFRHRARELFSAMFHPFDDVLVKFLKDWLDVATARDILTICDVLDQAHSGFVFEQRPFVTQLLEKAKQFGKKPLDRALRVLSKSAVSGLRSGTPGEPFPQDLAMKENADKALEDLPRFSPAYELYQDVRQCAELRTKHQLQEAERLEE